MLVVLDRSDPSVTEQTGVLVVPVKQTVTYRVFVERG